MNGITKFRAPIIGVILLPSFALHDSFGESTAKAGGLAGVSEKYSIEIVTNPVFPIATYHGSIDGGPATDKELEAYGGLFTFEFSLYPPDLVRRSELREVVLCKNLRFNSQRRNGIPDLENDTLYLDVSRGATSRTYLRKVLHHEFYHFVDFHDDGKLTDDARWTSLNNAGFEYGGGGKEAQDIPMTSVASERLPGFLNHYSTTAVEEDKAEIFAFLVVDPTYLLGRAKKEPVLQLKVDYMKDLLLSFCPAVDGGFGDMLSTKMRPEE